MTSGAEIESPTSRFAVAAAVNDDAILANCLARSPAIRSGALVLRTYRGASSAAIAYNKAIDDVASDTILILAHQDVYLPDGWVERCATALDTLTRRDPDWAVAGLVGKTAESEFVGLVWSTGMDLLLRGTGELPRAVDCLDELLLILRVKTGVRFDEDLPGFHLYGVDIVQEAKGRGHASYAIDAPVVHHDKVIPKLDSQYRRAWRYMRAKWRASLPIPTLIVPLRAGFFRLLKDDLRIRRAKRGIHVRTVPTSDPSIIAERLGWDRAADQR